MTAITVLAPVLARPQNAQPLADSLRSSTDRATIVFIVSPGDEEELDAVDATGENYIVMPHDPEPGDYARKINLGYRSVQAYSETAWVLLGADDLRFHPGWLEAVEACADANPLAGVVGTNDLGNPAVLAGRHSTHPVVRRAYIDELGGVADSPGTVYFEGYDHQWVDTELVATAQARGMYAHAGDAVVEHLHPLWGKSEDDATYRRSLANGRADSQLYHSRQPLWERVRV